MVDIFEGDCWQHLHNIWFGAIIKQLSKWLANILEDDLKKIPAIYCNSTEIEDLLCCTEKEFHSNANYAKGHGSLFEKWMHTYNPTPYLYPVVRACGSARQDLGIKGVPAVLMNLQFYLKFLNWWLSFGIGSNCILQRKLFTVLRSTNMVAVNFAHCHLPANKVACQKHKASC